MSILCYHDLEQYDVLSYYKLSAMSRACVILHNRKQSIRRGIPTKIPHMTNLLLTSCYGFKLDKDTLRIAMGDKNYFEIPLIAYVKKILSDKYLKKHAFILTPEILSIIISKDVIPSEFVKTAGIDRNLKNVAYGNSECVVLYSMRKAVKITQNTRSIVSSFRRNDLRIRQKLSSKYGKRRKNRINQLLHKTSKSIVQDAKERNHALVFEDIRYIRNMYRKGNGQGNNFRYKLNSWPFAEIKRQIEYKARWNGIQIIQLSKQETKGTSSYCPKCGKRLQSDPKNRELWCESCQRWLDRDVVAVMNQSLRGLLRFGNSKGDTNEAMKGNVENQIPLILRVDVSKSNHDHLDMRDRIIKFQ
jgi:putative transposase